MVKFTVTAKYKKDAKLADAMETVMNGLVAYSEFDDLAKQALNEVLDEWLYGKPDKVNSSV